MCIRRRMIEHVKPVYRAMDAIYGNAEMTLAEEEERAEKTDSRRAPDVSLLTRQQKESSSRVTAIECSSGRLPCDHSFCLLRLPWAV